MKIVKLKIKNYSRGFGVIEILIGASIITAAMFGLLGATQGMVRSSRQTERTVIASYLTEEGVEALRSIRDRGWANNIATLTLGTNYYFAFVDGMWTATTTATTTDKLFTRTFVLASVDRNITTSDISPTGGLLDPNTRKYTVTISFPSASTGTTTRSISGYITNLFNN